MSLGWFTKVYRRDRGEVLVMVALVVVLVILVVAGLIAAGRSFKVVQQYERGIIFRFGRVLPGTRGAGLTIIRPIGDRMQKVMQIVAMAIPAQDGITRDNVTVGSMRWSTSGGGLIKATINAACSRSPSSRPRSVDHRQSDGQPSERDTVNRLRRIIDEPTEGPGASGGRVESGHSLPESSEAIDVAAGRSRAGAPGRIITADGSTRRQAAGRRNVMARDPAALRLPVAQGGRGRRGKNSTLVMPCRSSC